MSTLTPQTVVLLEQLLASYREAELVFRRAAAQVQPERIQALLGNYAQMRSQLARELETALSRARRTTLRHNGAPLNGHVETFDIRPGSPQRAGQETAGYAPGDVHFALASALEECRDCDNHCLSQYPQILRRELSQPLRQIVSRQFAAVRSDHERLCELLPALQSEALSRARISSLN